MNTTSDSCLHPENVITRFLCAGGTVQWGWWCPRCEMRTSQSLPKASLDPAQQEAAPTIDLVARRVADELRWQTLREERAAAERPLHMRLRDDPEYQEYLRSQQWATLRRLVLERAGGKCEGCGRTAHNIHHMSYDHIYEEFLFELIALCRDCHERWHEVGVWERVS